MEIRESQIQAEIFTQILLNSDWMSCLATKATQLVNFLFFPIFSLRV